MLVNVRLESEKQIGTKNTMANFLVIKFQYEFLVESWIRRSDLGSEILSPDKFCVLFRDLESSMLPTSSQRRPDKCTSRPRRLERLTVKKQTSLLKAAFCNYGDFFTLFERLLFEPKCKISFSLNDHFEANSCL